MWAVGTSPHLNIVYDHLEDVYYSHLEPRYLCTIFWFLLVWIGRNDTLMLEATYSLNSV